MPRAQRTVPWLDQGKNGVYYVFWYNPGQRRTQRLSLRTRDASEAKDRYIAFLTEGLSVLRRPANAGVTVQEILDWYLREHAGVDPETRAPIEGATGVADAYRQWISAKRLRDYFGDTPVSSVGIPECRAYRDHRAQCSPPAMPPTVRREMTVLVAAANHAVRWKRLPADQVPQVELPAHAPVEDAKFFTREEMRAILAEASLLPDPRVRAFIVLAYATGARRKSIERLKKVQIDTERRRVALTPPGKVRTKKRAPLVPITEEMAAEIRRLLLWSGRSEYLFRDPGYDVYHKFAEVCRAAGIEDRTGPHVLRHSRATHMLQDGATTWEVAKLLGDTVETVERVYGHHCPDYMAGRGVFSDLSGILG